MHNFRQSNIAEVIPSNPGEVNSTEFSHVVDRVGKLLQSITAKAMLVGCLTLVVVDKEHDAFLHAILQITVDFHRVRHIITLLDVDRKISPGRQSVVAKSVRLAPVTAKAQYRSLLPGDGHGLFFPLESQYFSLQLRHGSRKYPRRVPTGFPLPSHT